MLLGKFKIQGHSMEPFIKESSEVLISSIPFLFSKPKAKDIVAFRHSDKVLIKRIKKVKSSHYLLEGDNVGDSLKIGWKQRNDIIGKVIIKL